MSLFNNELAFVHLLANLSNQQQIHMMLKHITSTQYSLMRTGACFILDQTLPLRPQEYRQLEPEKNFVRKLACQADQIKAKTLISKVQVLSLLAKKLLEYYEAGSKSCAHSERNLGRVENQKSNSDTTSDHSSSSEDDSSTDSSGSTTGSSQEEEEKDKAEQEQPFTSR